MYKNYLTLTIIIIVYFFTLCSCSKSDTKLDSKTETNNTELTVSISPNTLKLTPFQEATLKISLTPEDSKYKDTIWNSENCKVATIDEDGVVTAVAIGKTKICLTLTQINGQKVKTYCNIIVEEEEFDLENFMDTGNPLGMKSYYNETSDTMKIMKDIVADYGMISSETEDQSSKLQAAINDISEKGGGKLIIPNGTYRFSNIMFKSNVHLLISSSAILKPAWREDISKKTTMIKMHTGSKSSPEYIENCSVRGIDGKQFTVDFTDVPDNCGGVIFIAACMVKNYYIADANIKDNYSSHCAFSFSPTAAPNSDNWVVSRPTNGEVYNCSINNAHPGYGLIQIHGARNGYFHHLYAEGGVTFRLETGADTPNIGDYDLDAYDIINEDGKQAVMLAPHISENGIIRVDGVYTKNAHCAVSVGSGYLNQKGFAQGTKIINVHAVYGKTSQSKNTTLLQYNPREYEGITIFSKTNEGTKWLLAPSVGGVIDTSNGNYNVQYENITISGFKYGKAIMHESDFYYHDFADNKAKNNKISEIMKSLGLK